MFNFVVLLNVLCQINGWFQLFGGHVGLSLWETQSLWNLLLLGLSQNGQVSRETNLRSGLRFRTSTQLPLAPPWTVLKASWTDGSLRGRGVFISLLL